MDISICKPKLYFEKNLGQLPSEVKYKLKSKDYITFYTEDKLVVSLPSNIENTRNVFYMRFENINDDIQIIGQDKQKGIINYLIGNDESKWINDIPIYSKLKYHQVYENIDLYYYIDGENLEYDFVLSKGANPKDICISFEGVDNLAINDNDDVVLTVGDVCAILLKPEVYQIINEEKIYVDCKYILDDNKYVSFFINEYEKEYELVLDPVLKLDYSTFIGGTMCDFAMGIAVDSEGCAYITGYTEGDYPTTIGQTTFGGGSMDAFVTKFNKEGNGLMYSTYIGGSAADYSNGISIDDTGSAYIVGTTRSNDFPTTDSYQKIYGGSSDAFVTKLDSSGRLLLYSTYIGGSKYNVGNAIAIDKSGCAYITGQTGGSFPITANAFQKTYGGLSDAFVSKFDPNGKNLIYSTYLGGTDYDCGYGIAVDSEGCAYVTGYAGVKYPITENAYQEVYGGDVKDAFVTKVSPDGSELIYSTYLGGSSVDQGNAITIDDEGNAYVIGYTQGVFPTVNAYKNYFSGNRDIFVSKISIDGSNLIYSTYLGGGGTENVYSILVDRDGYAYLTGYRTGDVLFSKLSKDGSSLINYTSIRDGSNDYGKSIAIDNNNQIYITGYAENGYITTTDAYQTSCGGNRDAIVSKIMSIDFDLSFNNKPSKAKLLDTIRTKLVFKSLSTNTIDVNIKYQQLDSTISFIENSMYIQGTNYLSNKIPEEIYLPNIPPEKYVEIELELKYIIEKYPNQIPIDVIVEIYDNKTDTPILIDTRTSTFYIDTTIGNNYIPGCNSELYNLEIDGELLTTPTGTPIIYYKYMSSYIYRDSYIDEYVYKLLTASGYVIEHKIM